MSDKCSIDGPAYFKEVEERIKRGELPLSAFCATPASQRTIGKDAMTNSCDNLIGDTQVGKSGETHITLVKGWLQKKLVPVLVTLNSSIHLQDFVGRFASTDKFLLKVWELAGFDRFHAPSTRLFFEMTIREINEYKKCLKDLVAGNKKEIPVWVLLNNPSRVEFFRQKIVPIILEVAGKTDEGAIAMHAAIDEADEWVKTGDKSAATEEEWGKETAGYPDLYTATSTFTLVTATWAALHMNESRVGDKTHRKTEISRSKHYWGWSQSGTSKHKVISRLIGGMDEMMDDWRQSEDSRFALVVQSSGKKIKDMTASATKVATDYADVSGLVATVWTATSIRCILPDVADPKDPPPVLAAFRGAGTDTFEEKSLQPGVVQFEAVGASIWDYSSLVTWMHEHTINPKMVTYATNVAGRGVCLKSQKYDWPITDLILDAPKLNGAAMTQANGRATGNDTGVIKNLWASEDMHATFEEHLKANKVIVDNLVVAPSTLSNLRTLGQDVDDANEGASVEDKSGTFEALAGKRHAKPGAARAHNMAHTRVSRELKRKNITLLSDAAVPDKEEKGEEEGKGEGEEGEKEEETEERKQQEKQKKRKHRKQRKQKKRKHQKRQDDSMDDGAEEQQRQQPTQMAQTPTTDDVWSMDGVDSDDNTSVPVPATERALGGGNLSIPEALSLCGPLSLDDLVGFTLGTSKDDEKLVEKQTRLLKGMNEEMLGRIGVEFKDEFYQMKKK